MASWPEVLEPSIPINKWRIAVHLEATRQVQGHPASPATGCECLDCRNWRLMAAATLPPKLQQQLARLGITVEQPSDAYAFEQRTEEMDCRIVFHVIGKLLSGPPTWQVHPVSGLMMAYRTIRASPQWVSLLVWPATETPDADLALSQPAAGQLLRIDLRLTVPLHASLIGEVGQREKLRLQKNRPHRLARAGP